MATKPTDSIDWAPADPADVVEPAGADKLDGFQPGEKPPAQWFNWFWKSMSDLWDYGSDGVFVGDAGAHGLTVTGGTGNTRGVHAQGVGNGSGVAGTGGTSSGIGVSGQGGAPNGIGGSFVGDGNGRAIFARAEGTGVAVHGENLGTGHGADFFGGTNADGVHGTGDGVGTGVQGTGGATNGTGLYGIGGGSSGVGVVGDGGASGGRGGLFRGVTNAVGVEGQGAGTGAGVTGQSQGSGPGGSFLKGVGSGVIGVTTDGHVQMTGADPAMTDALKDVVTPLNVIQVLANFTPNNTADPASQSGFSVSTIKDSASGPSASTVRVTFAVVFPDTSYACFAKVDTKDVGVKVTKNVAYVDLEFFDTRDGASYNQAAYGAGGVRVQVMCIGAK